ncbi:tandem-95 repeat protein [Robertkochia marina]|uniref:Tandem-95 repeat protein n=1 Tax=Robertkochia marina TaxID=1227945 RepID=A0A4S3LWU8_9FLAO|nr:Ig-like domain-containing protein [Robertkochia marina]THD65648.1 tandem-95 repeat protein [Robertkochia marina]TRZ46671.1 tandem-95 repeat protein [Robertkochia marina]
MTPTTTTYTRSFKAGALLFMLLLASMAHAQFVLHPADTITTSNHRWYETDENGMNFLGNGKTLEVFTPGIYHAVYDGTLCGKNATSYFVVTWCGTPDDQVTLDISSSVPTGATVSWIPDLGNSTQPTVTALYGLNNQVTYTPTVNYLNNLKKLPSFTVICLQKPFVLVDDLVTTDEDVPVDIPMLNNDIDIPDVGVIGNTNPANGQVVINDGGTPMDPSDDTFTYTPSPGYYGPDSFTYTLTVINSDGSVLEETATINIIVNNVNDVPVAVDDFVSTEAGVPVPVNMLGNDYDPDGDPLTVINITQPGNGVVTSDGNGNFTYTPNDGFTGSDVFTYTISDGNGGSDAAYVTIAVTPPDVVIRDYAVDDETIIEEDTFATLVVLANDNIPADATEVIISDVEQPLTATVVVNADNTITVTPEPDFVGTLIIGYEIMVTTPGEVSVSQAVMIIEVTPVQDVVDDAISVNSFDPQPVVITILDNDTFNPATDVVVVNIADPNMGTMTINNDGTVTFLVDEGATGNEVVTYTVSVIHSDGTTNNEQGSIQINAYNEGEREDPPVEEDEDVYVHQLMTPNGDGQNDFLRIYGIENYPDNTVMIFNRWGVKVFETNGYDNALNVFRGISEGRMTISKNSMLPAGTYYYTLNYKTNSGSSKRLAGFFYINN